MEFANIPEVIRSIVHRYPDKPAIKYGKKTISFYEIHRNSSDIARFLRNNPNENKYVFVLLDKSPFLIESVLGVMRAGGIFVPIDPNLPENRIYTIMSEVGPGLIISKVQYLDKLDRIADSGAASLNVLIEWKNNKSCGEYRHLKISTVNRSDLFGSDEEPDVFNENCYVYFTSGSTGKPKGVLGRHESLKHFIDWEITNFGVDENFCVSQLTTPSFDPFLRDIFVPLCSGAAICIPDSHEIILNPVKLIKWIDENKISFIHMVPTLFRSMLSEIKDSNHFRSLKYILLAGELLKGNDLERFYELFGKRIQLVNLYGPTETTLAKAFYMISPDDLGKIAIPVGKPINGTEFMILDSEMRLCPHGTTGEIYIRTPYRSSGYLNDAELTGKVFVKNPFGDSSSDIIYKTGDLGRVMPDGNIECLGRIDNQVKIRGMRIEISEIETHIMKIDGINDAVVTTRESEDGDKFLCAFLVGEKLDFLNIRDYLSKELPGYMIPSCFVQIDKLPLLPNGKVDKNSLRNYEIGEETGLGGEEPQNEIEKRLTGIWKEVLHVRSAGITDHFFLSGGHSLKAAVLAAKIQKEFAVEFPVKEIFKSPTIKALAEFIRNSDQYTYSVIPAVGEREYYPVSSAQKRIYLVNQIENTGISYNMPWAFIIGGCPDIGILENAFNRLIERHESLRTSFEIVKNELVQRIHNTADFKLEYIEIEKDDLAEDIDNVDAYINALIKDFVHPFNLGQAPLFRSRLVKKGRGEYILLCDMHHIISDGVSEEILKDELAKLYCGLEPEKLKVQYRDFTLWQNEMLLSDQVKLQEMYWLDLFHGEIPVLNMPCDFTRPQKQNFEGGRIRLSMSNDFSGELKRVAAENGVTLYMLLLAAFNVLLSKYTGQEDIVIGSPVAGRSHADLESVTGVFINTLAIRNHPAGNKTFGEFLKEVRDNALEAFENQGCQFEKLVDMLEIKKDFSRNPLFDVMFIMQNMHFAKVDFDGLNVKEHKAFTNTSKFDLTLTAIENDQGVEFYLEYCTKLFCKETIERLGRHFLNVLKSIVENNGIKISDIDLLSSEEMKQILYDFNSTTSIYPSGKTIQSLFEEQVAKVPEKAALIFGDRKITYFELNKKSNQLAARLREKGVKKDSIVGLMVHRSIEMIVGMLAVLKAGGAYLPIDPGYPSERVAYMLENSRAEILLTQNSIENGELIIDNENPFIDIDLSNENSYSGDGANLEINGSASDLAYVIYTSGSTGRPKGVMIEHKNVCNFIKGITDKIDFSADKTILCLTTISFDIFVLETIVPLTKGLTIVIADELQQLDPGALNELILKNDVDMLQVTPSRLQMMLQSGKTAGFLEKIKELIIGGEAFPESLLKQLDNLKNTRIYNVYGPTETTVWSTLKELTVCKSINIGKPIANTQIYIFDKYNSLQPVGIPGELYIAGEGLARGYLGKPELTAERFIPNHFSINEELKMKNEEPKENNSQFSILNSQLIYRTGDLARWLPNGEIEFLGRADNQIKVRGYRIELSEIEKCMLGYDSVRNCVCIVNEDDNANKHLAAYYVSDEELPVSGIRGYLSKFLPDYMIPQSFTCLQEIPMTPNGKIDRKSLPKPDRCRPMLQEECVTALTETERKVAEVWRSILKCESIGMNDNFFDLGGNSLLLVIMHNSIEIVFPGSTGIADIFANPTVSLLSRFIDGTSGENLIKPINLPSEYFTDESLETNIVALEYTIEGDFYERLNLLQKKGIEPEAVLISVYACLLSEVTGEESVAIQRVIDYKNAAQLVVNLAEVTDIVSLFEKINIELQSKYIEDTFQLKDIRTVQGMKKDNCAIAAFSGDEDVNISDFGICHLLIKPGRNKRKTVLEFQYDASSIKKDKAEEFFRWYIRTAELMLNKIEI